MKWRRSLQEPRYQTDRSLQEDHHVQEFAGVFGEGLGSHMTSGIKQLQREFKDALNQAPETVLLVPEKREKD